MPSEVKMGNYFAPGFSNTLLLDDNKKQRRDYRWEKISVVDDAHP